MLEEAETFYETHGHWKIPKNGYQKLYSWAQVQRSLKRKSKLAPERVNGLEKIGFPWICPE